jgi:GNAT superfamily N-acetyltransferase
LEIRQARSEDAVGVHRVVQEAFGEYRQAVPVSMSALDETPEDVRREVSSGNVVVAIDGTEVVGTVRYEVKPEVLYVGRLAVLPSYQRRGVGAALMEYVEKLAPTLGRTRIELATRQSLPDNVLFYERLGYTVTERVAHPRGPDIVMWFEKMVGDRP